MTDIVKKPWGHEEIWACTQDYVGKILHIKKGCRLSLQYHNVKEETIKVLEGTLHLHHKLPGSDSLQVDILCVGESFHVLPKMIHRFEARDDDVTLVEVSTPHLKDVVRLNDDYGR